MIPSDFLSDEEVQVIERLLHYVLISDPVFEMQLYRTLTGVNMEDAVSRVQSWPDLDMAKFDDRGTVRGTLSNLVNYPHRCWDRIEKDTGVTKNDVKKLVRLIRSST